MRDYANSEKRLLVIEDTTCIDRSLTGHGNGEEAWQPPHCLIQEVEVAEDLPKAGVVQGTDLD